MVDMTRASRMLDNEISMTPMPEEYSNFYVKVDFVTVCCLFCFSYFFSFIWGIVTVVGAVVAQLASARLSEREVPGSIFSDFNVCFDFPLIRVAIALNTRKTEH